MPNRDMSELFETIGTLWVPDAPDRQVAGTLSCRNDRIELALADSLRPMQSGPLRFEALYPVVHGVTREQEAFSVFRCTGFHSLLFNSGRYAQPETLWSPLAIVGAHLTEQQFYLKLRCRIPALPVWLTPRIIQTVKDSEGFAFRIKNAPTETIAIPSIDAELDLKLEPSYKPAHSTATIVASGWLYIRPREPKLLSWFLDQLETIASLFAFLAGKPMPPDRIELRLEEHGSPLSVLMARPSVKYCDHAEHHNFFVSRTMLGDDLSNVVVNWFELFPRVENPISLGIATLASEDLWSHVRFLSLMQALEGLHRALFPGNYMDDAQYGPVRDALAAAIPECVGSDHRSSLKTRLRYGNQISLGKRLNQLTDVLPIALRTRIFGSNAVLRSWVDTRNYYTHWDEALRPNVLSDQSMDDTNVRLTAFLQTLYLHLAGAKADTLEAAFAGRSLTSLRLQQLNYIK